MLFPPFLSILFSPHAHLFFHGSPCNIIRDFIIIFCLYSHKFYIILFPLCVCVFFSVLSSLLFLCSIYNSYVRIIRQAINESTLDLTMSVIAWEHAHRTCVPNENYSSNYLKLRSLLLSHILLGNQHIPFTLRKYPRKYHLYDNHMLCHYFDMTSKL